MINSKSTATHCGRQVEFTNEGEIITISRTMLDGEILKGSSRTVSLDTIEAKCLLNFLKFVMGGNQ